MPGPPPKPTALKKLHGNPGHRPLNDAEPQPTAGIPEAPTPVVANEVALEERNSITVELHQLGLLTQIDMATLASYCMSFARWIEAEALVQKLGVMLAEPTLGPDGEEMGMRYKRNHATIISRDGRMAMCRYSSMFGFDPSSRTRICSPCGCVSACIDRIYHRFDCCAVWHRQSSRNDHGDHQ